MVILVPVSTDAGTALVCFDFQDHISSEKELVKQLFDRETSVRQAQIVVDWLERNAADTLDDYYDKVEFFLETGNTRGGAAW